MEGHCSTGQSPKWAVVSMEEKEEDRDSNWEAPEFKREALLRESSSWVL